MKITVLTVFGLTLLALVSAHHDEAEKQLLDDLINSHVSGNEEARKEVTESLNNLVDNLLKKAVERIKAILAQKEPFPVPDLPLKEIRDKNVQVNITLTNLKENKASQLKVNKLKNNFFLMTEQYDVSFPELDLEGNYVVNGKILGKTVSGKGNFNVWMTNLHTWGKAYAKVVKGAVQIKKLNVDYSIEKITAKATNLKVEGMSEEEVNKLLSTALLQYFTDNERLVSDTISGIVVKQANQLLKGMSVSDLLNWLKHFVTPPTETH